MIVKVKRYRPEMWSGVKFYTKENSYTIRPGIDDFGLPKTGLTKEDEVKLGAALNQDLSPQSTFWTNVFGIRIDQDELTLNTDIPMHELYYKVLLAKKNVAPSMQKALTMSKVDFVMYNEDQEAQLAIAARNSKKKAYAKLAAMNVSDMRNYLIACGRKPYDMTDQIVEDLVGKDVDTDPRRFILIANDENLNEKVFLNELLYAGIIDRQGHNYMYSGVPIGKTLDEVIEYFNHKENQPTYVALKKELTSYKKSNK